MSKVLQEDGDIAKILASQVYQFEEDISSRTTLQEQTLPQPLWQGFMVMWLIRTIQHSGGLWQQEECAEATCTECEQPALRGLSPHAQAICRKMDIEGV